jgi:hypothetical protein
LNFGNLVLFRISDFDIRIFSFAFMAAGQYNSNQQLSGNSTYGEAGSGGYY